MAILNEDALNAAYTIIGDNAKKVIDNNNEYRQILLMVASVVTLIVGVLLLILVPGFVSVYVSDALSRFVYYVAGIVVIIVAIILFVIRCYLHKKGKQKNNFDARDYGKEHFEDYINHKLKHIDVYLCLFYRTISLADNLVSAKILSSETGTKYMGKSHIARTYQIYEYELTYSDGTVKTETLRDDIELNGINILKYYLPSNSEEQENN